MAIMTSLTDDEEYDDVDDDHDDDDEMREFRHLTRRWDLAVYCSTDLLLSFSCTIFALSKPSRN